MTLLLQEWSALSDLFNILPTKVQSGLFTQDIKLTSVDVLPEFIALGTNFGLVYWYDRKKKDIQKLRCESSSVPITKVKIISTVDYMVACGNNEGNISIFQVPKSHHESLPENLKPKNKQVERYTVSELHKAPITSLEWSKNGMKLFSGDKSGHVVLTEIDFYMHICKSVEVLNESYEVVQLSYFQQYLLVSTTYRSIICKKEDKWKISQVGKKDRKVLGNFGGIFYHNSLRPNDAVLYCTRPGLRVWISDMEGSVQQTLLFKDLISQRSPEAALINPVPPNLKHLLPQKEASFGILLPFKEDYLVTYSNDVLYILNPKKLVVNMIVNHLRGILSVAVHKDEIFILEGERSLIRLSDKPEPVYDTASTGSRKSLLPITTLIKGITEKLQSSTIVPAIPTPFVNNITNQTDPTLVSNAEEARESPIHSIKQKIYDEISNQDFDDSILFKQKRIKKPDTLLNTSTYSSASSEENDGCISQSTLMAVSSVGILPDLRSPESIKHDIEEKEKKLAELLHLDQVKISCDVNQIEHPTTASSERMEEGAMGVQETATTALSTENLLIYDKPKIPVCKSIPNDWELQNIHVSTDESLTDQTFTHTYESKPENFSFKNSNRKVRDVSISDLSGEWEIV